MNKLEQHLIRIENIKTFQITVPTIHPSNPEYSKVWIPIIKKCVEGFWGFDNGGWRFMPPTLFFYSTFFKLEHTDRFKKVRTFIKPIIRDLDWMLHYAYIEAQGFSGFKKDNKYSCDKALLDEDLYKELEKSFVKEARIRFNDLHDFEGKKKTYVPAREYLRRLHDADYGKPHYYNAAKNLIILGSRGGGKSYTCAGIAAQTLTFDGIKELTKENYDNPPTIKVLLGAGNTTKSAELVSKITTALSRFGLDKDLGVWGDPENIDDYEPSVLFRHWVGDEKPGNTKNPFRYEYEVKTPQGWAKKGTKSALYHINYSEKKQDGAQAGAGSRTLLSITEEIGLTSNFRDLTLSNNAVVSVDGEQVGVQIGIGTSGNIDLIQQTRLVFDNPQDYNFLEYENIWEESDKPIGFFVPAYLTEQRFKDQNGNTNLAEALAYFEKRRLEEAKKDDPAALYNEKMNYPLIPSDMWVSNKGSYFCQLELMERERELLINQQYKELAQPTRLIWDSTQLNGVKAEYDGSIELIHTFPFDKSLSKLDGGIAIYEKPQMINGEVPKDMYIFTFDPYVSENINEGGSLGVTLGFLNPKYAPEGYNGHYLVCSYIGKHSMGKDAYYENQEKLLAYYGNPYRGLWYEANRGESVRGYYTRKNKLNLLCLRPNKEKGSSVFDKKVLEYGYFVGNQIDKIQMCDDLNEILLRHTIFNGSKKRVVETLPCLFLVQQLIGFSLKGNFDAVSSYLGYGLAIKEMEHKVVLEKNKQNKNPLAFLSLNPNIFKNTTFDKTKYEITK